MRVLMTADTVGGVFAYAVELAGALHARGVDVTLAAQGGRLSRDQRAEVRAVPGLDVRESDLRLEWMEDPWDDVARSSERIEGLVEEVRPDVVHLNEYAHGALALGRPKLTVGHSCVCSWFEAVRGAAPPPSFDRYRREVARGLAGADLVVAPTRWMLAALERHHAGGEGFRRARVIPNGRSPERFRPGRKEPFILCAGRLWDEAKNVAALDEAARHVPWPVLVAGEEEHPDPASRGAARIRNARPLGRLAPDALARWLSRATIYALPARYEPFGLSVLEAALSGCALVLGDIPSLRETWEGAALFVAPESPGDLARALARVSDDPGLASHLGATARERALAYTPDPMAGLYLAAYEELLSGPGAPEEPLSGGEPPLAHARR